MDNLKALRRAADEAREIAHGCPVYAPPQNTDAGTALYHATRSGATSAMAGQRWMEAEGRYNAALAAYRTLNQIPD